MKVLHNLIPIHGAWADRNFDNSLNLTHYGVGEEVGELTHSILKMRHGIRGTPVEHSAAIGDAIADALLFLAHVAHRNGIDRFDISDEWPRPAIVRSEGEMLGELFCYVGELMKVAESKDVSLLKMRCCYIIAHLVYFATAYGVDLDYILKFTATQVHARDFRLYPLTGRPRRIGA